MKRAAGAAAAALDVYWGGDRVGHLTLDAARRFVFQYAAAWLASAGAHPLSISMPLRPEPYTDDAARPYFANLLPEAHVREAVARSLGVSEQNDFALLERLGGECAGAVSLWTRGEKPPSGRQTRYRKLCRDEMAQLVANLPRQPLLRARKRLRLSLAGAQEKLPVLRDGTDISLPEGGAPSTHILKPQIPAFEDTVGNEAFCLQLAGLAGLPVPPAEILDFGARLFLVHRFDRTVAPRGRIERLHQEDFCQALGFLPDQKYESEGGPRLSQCFELLSRHSIRAIEDRRSLLRWVIFNTLIGNADGHAKNLSLLHEPVGPCLAPFYDLLCTAVHPQLSAKLALKVGGENRLPWIQRRHWERLAEDAGVKAAIALHYCEEMAERLPALATGLEGELAARHGASPIVRRVVKLVEASSSRLLSSLAK